MTVAYKQSLKELYLDFYGFGNFVFINLNEIRAQSKTVNPTLRLNQTYSWGKTVSFLLETPVLPPKFSRGSKALVQV